MNDTVKHILVVDDEADIRRFLAVILEDAGFSVDVAENGDEALDKVKARAPDLISLDLVMPGKSGTKFLYALRKDREWARIPVLVVTGHAHDELGKGDLEDILAGKVISGPAVYLEKPVTPKSYVAAVKRQLGMPEEAPADVRGQIAAKLADADPETMRKILDMLE